MNSYWNNLRFNRLLHFIQTPPPPPEFPPFPVRACVVGKLFSGKTTCVNKLAAGMLTFEPGHIKTKTVPPAKELDQPA